MNLLHKDLLQYLLECELENTNREIIGGVLIPDDNGGVQGFKYPHFRINDTKDLTGWSFFNPAEMNKKK